MALIGCKECGKQYSDKANACPQCACPTETNQASKQNLSINTESAVPSILNPAQPENKKQANYNEISEFIEFIKQKNSEAIINAINSGFDLNTVDKNKISILFYAIQYGSLEIIKTLIEKGANVNYSNEAGITPLMIASSINSLEIVKFLINAKANIACRDQKGKQAIDYTEDAYIKNYINSLQSKEIKTHENSNLQNNSSDKKKIIQISSTELPEKSDELKNVKAENTLNDTYKIKICPVCETKNIDMRMDVWEQAKEFKCIECGNVIPNSENFIKKIRKVKCPNCGELTDKLDIPTSPADILILILLCIIPPLAFIFCIYKFLSFFSPILCRKCFKKEFIKEVEKARQKVKCNYFVATEEDRFTKIVNKMSNNNIIIHNKELPSEKISFQFSYCVASGKDSLLLSVIYKSPHGFPGLDDLNLYLILDNKQKILISDPESSSNSSISNGIYDEHVCLEIPISDMILIANAKKIEYSFRCSARKVDGEFGEKNLLLIKGFYNNVFDQNFESEYLAQAIAKKIV